MILDGVDWKYCLALNDPIRGLNRDLESGAGSFGIV